MQIRDLFTSDALGIDPLDSHFFDVVQTIQSYSTHTITSQEHLNPALTSYNMYRNKMWWQVIMAYNNISDLWDFTEGTRIRVPDLNEMTSAIQRKITVKPEKIVTI